MPWLERLDKKSQTWPLIARQAYWALKWYLILLGGFCIIRLALDRVGIWPLY